MPHNRHIHWIHNQLLLLNTMNTAQAKFIKHNAINYNSLPYSGEHEAEHDLGHKKKWGTLGKAFIRELAKNCNAIAICPHHNMSGSIDRGEISGFLTNEDRDKFIYININDSGLTPSILYRTAKHEKDYTGGSNNFSKVDDTLNIEVFISTYLNE